MLNSEEFSTFFKKTQYPSVVRSYTKSITYIYKDWLENGKEIDFNVLTELASNLIDNGYSGLIKK